MSEGKVVKAKKFIKTLSSSQYSFVFTDPKETNEFFKYVNAKYQITYDDDIGNIPVLIDNTKHFLTFYEVNKETETINLIPIMINAKLEDKGHPPLLKDAETSRTGTWYIAICLTDKNLKDSLNPNRKNHTKITNFLKNIQNEYLSTTDYIEIYFKN